MTNVPTLHKCQFQRWIATTLIAFTLVACGSDGKDGADAYLAAVVSEPAGANCANGGKRIDEGRDTNGNGVLDASEITDTQYVCNVPPLAYTIGGTVTGLNGSVVLENDVNVFLTMSASGNFTFGPAVIAGDAYAVSVHTQPPGQTCTVANGSGIATADVTNVQVTCTTHPLTLVSTSPAADATDVDRTASASLVFSAALDAATVTSANVTLTSAGGDQPIALSVSGTQLTAIPTRQLLPATTYTLQASTGVQGIHDEQLATAASGSFTTQEGQWRTAVLAETNDAGAAQIPQIAVDPNGNAILVWQQSDGTRDNIWASRYTPVSGWGTPVLIEQNDVGHATNPHVAMDADGNALAVWQQQGALMTSIWANRYTVGVGWGTPTLIETTDLGAATDPKVAFDAGGNALAVWRQAESPRNDIWANRYVAGVGWGEATLVETDDAAWVGEPPQLAVHASGNAVAVWGQGADVWANRYTVGAGWGTPVLLEEDDTGYAQSMDVAIDGNGYALAVWHQRDATRNNIWSARSTPDGRWGPATLVETEDTDAWQPRIAMDVKGNATVVWRQVREGVFTIRSNRYTPEGGWGTAELIQSDVTTIASPPQIAVDAAGNALAVWHQSGTLRYNRYTTDGGWGTSAPLDPVHSGGSQFAIAMDVSGNAHAAWSQDAGGRSDIYVKRFD